MRAFTLTSQVKSPSRPSKSLLVQFSWFLTITFLYLIHHSSSIGAQDNDERRRLLEGNGRGHSAHIGINIPHQDIHQDAIDSDLAPLQQQLSLSVVPVNLTEALDPTAAEKAFAFLGLFVDYFEAKLNSEDLGDILQRANEAGVACNRENLQEKMIERIDLILDQDGPLASYLTLSKTRATALKDIVNQDRILATNHNRIVQSVLATAARRHIQQLKSDVDCESLVKVNKQPSIYSLMRWYHWFGAGAVVVTAVVIGGTIGYFAIPHH